MVVHSIDQLTSHSYIAKAQSRFLKMRKENLEDNSIIFLGDFAENFSFVIQDEIQSHHWSKQQATLHPVVIYYKDDNILKHQSFCFISDDLSHDTSMVYSIQKTFTKYLKMQFRNVTKVEYFSDGCAAQYKNKNNFKNLCMHKHDFGLEAEWNFFATAHGKSPCDGIGGLVKRVTAVESLKRIQHNQILTPEDMYNFCRNKFKDIIFFYIPKSDIDEDREFLKTRFLYTQRIPGTRSFHRFKPINSSNIEVMRSSDQVDSIKYDIDSSAKKEPSLIIGSYIACIYDNNWWIGLVLEVFNEDEDADIKFMHYNQKTKTFKWPSREDKCLVPFSHFLCEINELSFTSKSRRQYNLSSKEMTTILQKFKENTSHQHT